MPYPLEIKRGNGKSPINGGSKIQHGNGNSPINGSFNGNITDNGPFSSTPCLSTAGYEWTKGCKMLPRLGVSAEVPTHKEN